MDKLTSFLDSLTDKYLKNHAIIYENDPEKLKKFRIWEMSYKRMWETPRKCLWFGCEKDSIKQSHTIQKASSLNVISENNALLVPEKVFDGNILEYKLKKIYTKRASAFPGFCEEHENYFGEFEKKKELDTPRGCALQLFRSTCREIFRIRIEIEVLEEIIILHQKDARQFFIDELRKNGFKHNLNKVTHSGVTQHIDDVKKGLKDTLLYLEKEILPEFDRFLVDGNNNFISIHGFTVDHLIPVSLSGIHSFSVNEENVTVIVNVLPFEKETKIMMGGRKKDEMYIYSYLSRVKNTVDLINMIEGWMNFSTDHWFIKPSVWNSIGEKRKKRILKDMSSDSVKFESENSIFDEIRKSIVEDIKNSDFSSKKQQIIRRELEKMCDQ